MQIRLEISGLGTRPYPLDHERQMRVLEVLLGRNRMSISALARELNLTRVYVSNIISGRRLSVKIERRIAEYLGKPADYLFPPRTAEEIGKMRRAEAAGKGKAA